MKIDERIIEMHERRVSGESLRNIGMRFGITRERVRQLIVKYYPEYVHPKKNVKEIRECKFCGKKILDFKRAKTKYCSKRCSSEGRKNNRTEQEKKNYID